MGKNIFGGQQFNTPELVKLQKNENNEQAEIKAAAIQETRSIFSDTDNSKNSKPNSDKNIEKANNSLSPTLAFGLSQRNTVSAEKVQPAVSQSQAAQPVQPVQGGASIFLGGSNPSFLTSSANDNTSIFNYASKIGGYAIYNRQDASFKAHKLTEEEVAAQKGLTGEKRTNPKPYNAKIELEANPYAAYSEVNPEFLQKPDALEMLNPVNWFKKNNNK